MRDRLIELIKKAKHEAWLANKLRYAEEFIEFTADNLLENGVIVPPCKVGDTVYAIPSKANRDLNKLKGLERLNRVYEPKVSKVEIFADNKYLLTTCDGMYSVHGDFYGETWFLTREEAERALKGGAE